LTEVQAIHHRPGFYYGWIIVGLGLVSMSLAPLFMATAADLFKGRIFGLICGIVEGTMGFGGSVGSWVAGFIFDQTKSYRLLFVLAIVVCFLSCVFIWIAAPRKARKRVTSDK